MEYLSAFFNKFKLNIILFTIFNYYFYIKKCVNKMREEEKVKFPGNAYDNKVVNGPKKDWNKVKFRAKVGDNI